MSKTKLTSLIVAVALILVAVGGVVMYNNASAQAATPGVPSIASGTQTPPDNQQQTNPQQGGQKGQPGDGKQGAAHDTALATALGITVEKLQAAFQAANTEALKEAVSQGLMTQSQADQITTNGVPNHAMREFGKPGSTSGIDYDTLLANALGISKDALQAAQVKVRDAQLDADVQSGQLTQAQADEMKARDALMANSKFQTSMKSAYQAAIQQAVTDGVITQAQADQILKDNPNGFGPGGMGGPGGGRGGPGGQGGGRGGPGGQGGPNGKSGNGNQNQQNTPTAPSGN